ncbi:hypothetical protein K2Z83_12635 [Oscillochloris sp. ZM17-4]|uniref:hypothetical protein n=1 Tax=Oscillochloris sp. ZM17-4 TaxID=2866714 RepID=UPI001C72A40F|nr:hypothetical protein [Oscillochloris sp. ZM17-4]MBX0328524.1 hypothetical protein [Oscillochloris sp. ZM17-4]
MTTQKTPPASGARWSMAILIVCVLLLVIVAIGDVLFAGTSATDGGPTATPTSLLFAPLPPHIAYA